MAEMVAERQVEKMQKFVKEYSAKMNEIEEALDESLVRFLAPAFPCFAALSG